MSQIRTLTPADVAVWLRLAHETSDDVLRNIGADPAVFYDGFDQYMEAKIRQSEAFMAVSDFTGECEGIIAFSRKHNRISFLGVFPRYDLMQVGSLLVSFAADQLDAARPIQSTVLQILEAERRLYEALGFKPCGDTIEAGVSATVMERSALSGLPQRA